MENLTYKLIRSQRRTMGLEVRPEGVILRAPMRATKKDIEAFLQENLDWIRKHKVKMDALKEKTDAVPKLSMEEIRELAYRAATVIPARVRYYAPLIGVTYGRITIRNQRSKWGSCTAKGNLNFNCLLLLAPPEVLDSVVVHELCHRKYMNHSREFYAEIHKVFPEYKRWDRWLKENGTLLMSRMGC